MEELEYITGGRELLDAVGPLWERLRAHHAAISPRFAPHVNATSYDRRRASLAGRAEDGALRIDLVRAGSGARDVAYCVCTIDPDGTGEIESLFVEEALRGRRVGDELVRRALSWMDRHEVRRKVVGVLVGNERAHSLYARFGFHPRTVILEQVP